MKYLIFLFIFSLISLNLFSQKNAGNSLPSKYLKIGKNETISEINILKLESKLSDNIIQASYDSTLTQIFYQNLDSLNKRYPYNFKFLSTFLYWSTELKKYSDYSNRIIDLVNYYYTENQEKFYSNAKEREIIEKISVYYNIMEYQNKLYYNSSKTEFKKINDEIYKHDKYNYTNLIFRADYMINSELYDEAIDILDNEIYGYELNDAGEVTNDYDPFEVDLFLAKAYMKKGNNEKAIGYLEQIIASDSRFVNSAFVLKAKVNLTTMNAISSSQKNIFNYRADSVEIQNLFELLNDSTLSLRNANAILSMIMDFPNHQDPADTILLQSVVSQLTSLIEVYPNDFLIRDHKLRILFYLKQYVDFKNEILEVIALLKKDHDYFGEKELYEKLDDLSKWNMEIYYKNKAACFEICTSIEKEFGFSMFNSLLLSNYHRVEKNYEIALSYLAEAEEEYVKEKYGYSVGSFDDIYFEYGRVYRDMNDKVNALKYFEKVDEYYISRRNVREEIEKLKK